MSEAVTRLVPPPKITPRRCRGWDVFARRFGPLPALDHECLWEPGTLPIPRDPREWWTVLDCDGQLLLMAGFHFVNRLNYIRCRNRWGGNWDEHPNYLLD